MLESKFQSKLIRDLKIMFPGCIVLKNDANYIQGFQDLTVLYNNSWAVLECKRSLNECYRPNQEYYISVCNQMSFGSMICPENRKDVLDELQRSFSSRRAACRARC